VISTTVDADNELGNYHFLLPNQWYNLTTGGGPWYDVASGGTGRYDLAYSFDRITWWPVGSQITETGCIEDYTSPEYVSWYFYMPLTGTLPGGAFYVRVNDLDDMFADNRDDMGYTIRNAVGPEDPYQPGSCPYLVYGDPVELSVTPQNLLGAPALPIGWGSTQDDVLFAIEFTGAYIDPQEGGLTYESVMNSQRALADPAQSYVPTQAHPHVLCAENLGTQEQPRYLVVLQVD